MLRLALLPELDEPASDDAALELDLRARLLAEESRGPRVEVARFVRGALVEHLVLSPGQTVTCAGVRVSAEGRGRASVDARPLVEGDRAHLLRADGELLVRFAPAPERFLPAQASRLAFVLVLLVACVAAFGGGRAAPVRELPAAGEVQVAARARRDRARARQRQRAQQRVLARGLARRTRRVMKPHAARAIRPVRKSLVRRACGGGNSDSDGDGGPDPDPDDRRARAPLEVRARGPPRADERSAFVSVHTQEEDMFVVQIFVMKHGALEGIELATGSEIVIGPQDADVPLADGDGSAVAVELAGDALRAHALGGDVRIDGERVHAPRAITPQSDVQLGAYTLKLRRMPLARRAPEAHARHGAIIPDVDAAFSADALAPTQPAPTRSAPPRPAASVPAALAPAVVTLAPTDPLGADVAAADTAVADVAVADVAVADVAVAHAAVLDARLAAYLLDDEDGAQRTDDADGADDVAWSLVDALARARPETARASEVSIEVLRCEGERVVGYALLPVGARDTHAGVLEVRRVSASRTEVRVPAGARAQLMRGHEVRALEPAGEERTIALGVDESAWIVDGVRAVRVRATSTPRLARDAEELLRARAERRVQAWSASAGLSLCSLWMGALWLLEYRAREAVVLLDDDVTKWTDVELVMSEPPPPAPPEPEPEAAPEPEQAPAMASASPASPRSADTPRADKPRTAAPKGADAAAGASHVLDVVKGLPALETNRVTEALFTNVRAPLTSKRAAPIMNGLIGRGTRVSGEIGGSGLDTSSSGAKLKQGAGGLARGEAREVRGRVDRAQLGKLKLPVEQGLSRDEILRVINQHIGEIQVCFERALRDRPGLQGRVQIEWGIAPSGDVRAVRQGDSTTLGDAAAVQCMLSRVARWKFPRSAGPSQVLYPFNFAAL